jgi:hypothetical protein
MDQDRHVSRDGFAIEPTQLEKFAKQWDDLADDYRENSTYTSILRQVAPPGREYASENITELIRASIGALTQAFASHHNYCQKEAEKYRKAINEYTAKESSHKTAIAQMKNAQTLDNQPHGSIG